MLLGLLPVVCSILNIMLIDKCIFIITLLYDYTRLHTCVFMRMD